MTNRERRTKWALGLVLDNILVNESAVPLYHVWPQIAKKLKIAQSSTNKKTWLRKISERYFVETTKDGTVFIDLKDEDLRFGIRGPQ